jgi:hypothetical protein
MSDVTDKADVIIEMITKAAIDEARKEVHLHADGHCLYCDEDIAPGLKFCNRDCRDDWDQEQRALKISGKV